MPLKKTPGSDAPRPLKTQQDEQRYTPTPRRIPLPVPLPGIFDDPAVCIRVNREWWSHVSGMIDTLSSEELWLGSDDDKTRALREIAKLLVVGEGCMPDFDCGDVEDCLETSTIINNIEININNINNEVQEIQDNAPIDDVVLPDNPTMPSSANDLCRAANYVAVSIAAVILEVWEEAGDLTLQEFMSAILGVVWWDFTKAKGFWQYALTISDPTLAADAQAYIDQVKNHLFCAQLDLEMAILFIFNDSTIPPNENTLWRAILNNYTQSQIDELAMIGTLDTATPDCSEGCPWIIVYDFTGNFTPVGDETLIIEGDSWTHITGHYDAAIGYVADGDQMILEKPLPEQCRLSFYQVSIRRGASMTAVDLLFYWRDASGIGPPQYSPAIRSFSDTFVTITFTVLVSPLMPTAAMIMDAVFGSPPWGQAVEWVKLIGTGAYPQS